jgi:putative FmdB family regulatory protein
MPIYAYRCSACGHAQDVLQKVSDPVLTTCPACGAEAFTKQVTAAGFQLKGSGWYVTDFRGGDGAKKPAAEPAPEGTGTASPAADAPAKAPEGPGATAPSPAAAAASPASPAPKPTTAAPAPAPTPAASR